MPSAADIIKDYVSEFSRLQDWMIPIKQVMTGWSAVVPSGRKIPLPVHTTPRPEASCLQNS